MSRGCCLVGLLLGSSLALAQEASVVADGTLGTLVSENALGGGVEYSVTGGTTSGVNLFHSFESFSIDSADQAVFSTSSATPLAHVISRVTGGAESVLNGRVATSGAALSGAAFWLLNPAGVLIGADARFDIGGALNVGAASAVSGEDGSSFDMTSAPFASAPTGFDVDPASTSRLRVNGFDYQPADGLGLLLAGGAIEVESANISVVQNGSGEADIVLRAGGGALTLNDSMLRAAGTGAANAGRIRLSGARLVANGSALEVTTAQGNTTDDPSRVEAFFSDSIRLTDVSVTAETLGPASSGPLLFVTEQLTAVDVALEARSLASGAVEGVFIQTSGDEAALTIGGASVLSTDTSSGSGSNGGVALFSDGIVELTGSVQEPLLIESLTGAAAESAGRAVIGAASILLTDTRVSIGAAIDNAIGDSSLLFLEAENVLFLQRSTLSNDSTGLATPEGTFLDGRFVVLQDSFVSSRTLGAGRAGSISIAATELLEIDSSRVSNETTAAGDGGTVVLTSGGDLNLSGSGTLIGASSSQASGGGAAGEVAILAAGTVTATAAVVDASSVSGRPGFISVGGTEVSLLDTRLSIDTASDDNGSSSGASGLNVSAIEGVTLDGAELSASTSGAADARPVLITAADIQVVDSRISATTSGAGNAGAIFLGGDADPAGNLLTPTPIRVEASVIESFSTGTGSFGSINLTGGQIDVVGSALSVETASPNQADQTFAAAVLTARDSIRVADSQISARTTGGSDAGRISIGGQNVRFDSSTVISSSEGLGSAGAISIGGDLVSGSLLLVGSSVLSDTRDGGAGLVQLVGADVLVRDTQVSTSTAGAADAGRIFLGGNRVQIDEGSQVASRATGTGDSNRIDISAPGGFNLISRSAARPSRIQTDSLISQGGDIAVSSGGMSSFQNAEVEASAGADGNGGNIAINTNGLLMASTRIVAQAVNGAGGQIDLNLVEGAVAVVDSESIINADSQNGTAGQVVVDAPDTGIQSALSQPSAQPAADAGLVREVCELSGSVDEQASTLFVREPVSRRSSPDGYASVSSTSMDERRFEASGSGCGALP